jgi:RND family efflux transporter MFP subunit
MDGSARHPETARMDISEKLRSLSIDREPGAATRKPGRGRWVYLAGACLLALAAALFFLRPDSKAPERTARQAASAPSAADTKPRAPVASRGGLVASGYIVARRSATVSVDITGRLTDVLFEEGAVVERGQVLARLDDSLARFDLELAEGRLAAARSNIAALKAQLIEAESQRERTERLFRTEAVAKTSMEAAVAKMDALRAQHEAALADARVAELAVARQREYVDRHIVRAPFAGVIIAKNAQAGEILSPAAGGGQFTRTGVATLVDMASLEVEVDVNEGQIADVTSDQSATIVLDAYPDWKIPGKVIAIIPTANRDRATIQVRVGLEVRDQRILPQMAAKVTFDRAN